MKQLIVEVDFEDSQFDVGLRFYRSDGQRRQIMRMQEVFNLQRRQRRGIESDWPEPDQRLLSQLLPELGRSGVLQQNLQVLKLGRAAFEKLADRWAELPGRFVDRRSQLAYDSRPAPAELRLELTVTDGQGILSAFLVGDDGAREAWDRVAPLIDAKRRQAPLGGRLRQLDLPLDLDLLEQLFGRGPVRAPAETLAQHLPTLLGGRLELLAGPAVRRRVHEAPLEVRLRGDGGAVLVGFFAGGRQLLDPASSSWLVYRGGLFQITELRLTDADAARAFADALPTPASDSSWRRVRGDSAEIARLLAGCRRLPDSVKVVADAACRSLLNPPVTCEPELVVRAGRGWLEFDLQAKAGDTVLAGSDLRSALGGGDGLLRTRTGDWLQLDPDSLQALRDLAAERGLLHRSRRLNRLEAGAFARTVEDLPARADRSARSLLAELRELGDAPDFPLPDGLRAELRHYQEDGVAYLRNRDHYRVGCLLADDMGLGKTVQVLAAIQGLREAEGPQPSLVVCPASVLSVWAREARRFTPELRVLRYVGAPESRRAALAAGAWDLALCTYATARNDAAHLAHTEYRLLVLDEAQQIKNPDAQVSQAVRRLPARQRVAVTGTPLENRLLDLWSIMDFLNPGYFGTRDDFNARYGASRPGPELRERLAPLILRRRKEEVATELPPKTVETVLLPFAEHQQQVYDNVLRAVRANVAGGGAMAVLAGLTRLRQVCGDPRLLPAELLAAHNPDPAHSHAHGAKLAYLRENLEEVLAEGHSALVFSQFTGFLELLRAELEAADVPHWEITGATSATERERRVAQFQESPRPEVFLLSLRAAGAGLTLGKAEYVYLCDPWWNPAVENQAIDRAHRIGQERAVFAYRLAAADSVEEKVLALQEEKRELFAGVVEGTEAMPPGLKVDDLLALLG